MAADLARNTGRFNLTQGIIGTAVGIGASISTTFAGYVTDHYGSHMAFLGLAAVATCAFLFVYLAMPETRPDNGEPHLTATPNAAAAPWL